MQERAARQAVDATRYRVTGAVVRPTIATDHVTAGVSEVGVVEPKLRVIEDVERLGAELQNTRFTDRKMLEQAHVKIQASGIVQIIATSVSEGQAARCDE